jgi:hypothetical protein
MFTAETQSSQRLSFILVAAERAANKKALNNIEQRLFLLYCTLGRNV